jgi:hypothetical protein
MSGKRRKSEIPIIPFLNMDKLTAQLTLAYQMHENAIFEDALRKNAVPPVKGKITKGKIQWRGIKIYQSQDYPFERWLTQRGAPISEKVSMQLPYLRLTND